MVNTVHHNHLWDALVGQPQAVQALRQLAEQAPPARGNRLIFSGPAGTGKTTASNLLAAALHAAAPITTHAAYLRGLSPARAYQQLQNLVARSTPVLGVLVIDGAGEFQRSNCQGARAGLLQFLSQFPGLTTILIDHGREIDNLTDRHAQLADVFNVRIDFPTLDPRTIRTLTERSAQRHGLRLDNAAGQLVEAVAAQLAAQTTPTSWSLLDRLGNGWLCATAVRTASRAHGRRLSIDTADPKTLSAAQLTTLTEADIREGLGTAIASAH